MRADRLDYDLPESSIAQHPPARRDGARLMVLGLSGIEHRVMRDFAELVPRGSLLIVNQTRVRRARLLGVRRATGGRAEILLLRPIEAHDARRQIWKALGRANRPLRQGAVIDIGDLRVTVIGSGADGILDVELSAPASVDAAVQRFGRVPLPPYVRREVEPEDDDRYQTIYAAESGSAAAPTAGLHLTSELFSSLAQRDVTVGRLTLHVGLGTFRPVTAEDLDQHAMHEEEFSITEELVRQVADARRRGALVVAVGTTVVRALESARDPLDPRKIIATRGTTSLLIQPGYRFGPVDALLTNFHMPRSTLLALVTAFAGVDRLLSAYHDAVASGYRFLSYGDAMWIPERDR